MPSGPHRIKSERAVRRGFSKLTGCVVAAVFAGGCVSVKPWQRGTIADSTMRPDRDPVGSALNEHVWFSREAAAGGRGVGGGGCGCN